jgi:hypothetical protein
MKHLKAYAVMVPSAILISSCSTDPGIVDKYPEIHQNSNEVWHSCQLGDTLIDLSIRFHTIPGDIQHRNNFQSLPMDIVDFQLLVPNTDEIDKPGLKFHWNISDSKWSESNEVK